MSFDPRKKFGTSKKKETDGATVDLGDGATITIRRQSYPPAAEFLRKAMRPHKQALSLGTLPESTAEKIIIDCLVEHLLIGWTGFSEAIWEEGRSPVYDEKSGALVKEGIQAKDAEGNPLYKPLEFSKKAARRLLRELPDLRALFWGYSDSADIFRREEEEEDAKN